MTLNLQIVLAIIGVVVVLMIYLVSKWQHRMRRRFLWLTHAQSRPKNRSQNQDSNNSAPASPVYAGKRLDGDSDGNADGDGRGDVMDDSEDVAQIDSDAGAFPDTSPDISAKPNQPTDAREPVFTNASDAVADSGPTGLNSHSIEGFEQLSQIDYWVKITGERDVGRESVLAIYHAVAADFSKTRGLYGFKMPQRTWCSVEDEAEDSRFTDLVMTIQLADCNGAISEREMARFSALVARLSEGTGREFVFMAPVENALAQAEAIAEFTRHYQSIFIVNIRPQEGVRFQGAIIDRYARQMGMEADGNHYYARFKTVGKDKVTLYSLADMSDTGQFDFDNMKTFSTDGLTFFTRPAVNRSPGAVFAEMVDTAKAFASRIKGVASTPNHDDLAQHEVDAIRQSIEKAAATMQQQGIAAGSDEAARIF